MLNFWSHNLLNGIIFTIKASPETATVQINSKVRNSVAVAPGATVSWSVSASGYYTQTGSQTVKSSTTKTIELKKVPYTVNQKLLDVRPSSTSAVSGTIDIQGSGRFKLELEAAGAAGSGWQDSNIWAGGGSGAAIVAEVILFAGKYNYNVPGKTKASGFWSCGGNGGNAYFKSSSGSAVNFQVTGGQSKYGSTKNAGGTVSSFTGTIKKTILKKNGNTAEGWTNIPNAENAGGASVYSVDGVKFGAGGSTNKAGNQGFLRLTFLGTE